MGASDKTSLGDRMKGYEIASRSSLPARLPMIIRVDGKAFHTYTRGCKRPWDENLVAVMNETAAQLCKHVQGTQIAYVQSDEISLLVHNYKTLQTQSYFDGEIQKIVSITASIAGAMFTANSGQIWGNVIKPAFFDSRVFILPESEVCNYFIWRQQDMSRNSIQMLARSIYSHKELQNKNSSELQEMCFQKGHNWNDEPTAMRRGRCIVRETVAVGETLRHRWKVDNEIPLFTADRDYINKHLVVNE